MFLDKKFKIVELVPTVPKKQLCIVLPYLGKRSLLLKKQLSSMIHKNLGMCKLRVIFKCSSKVSSMLSFKDRIPLRLQSHVVYKFKCHGCNAVYYGLCWRHIGVRWWEHMSLSWRTGERIKTVISDVNDHVKVCKTPIDLKNFEIAVRKENNFKLRIKESLFVQHHKSKLNKNKYSTPLMLF